MFQTFINQRYGFLSWHGAVDANQTETEDFFSGRVQVEAHVPKREGGREREEREREREERKIEREENEKEERGRTRERERKRERERRSGGGNGGKITKPG